MALISLNLCPLCGLALSDVTLTRPLTSDHGQRWTDGTTRGGHLHVTLPATTLTCLNNHSWRYTGTLLLERL